MRNKSIEVCLHPNGISTVPIRIYFINKPIAVCDPRRKLENKSIEVRLRTDIGGVRVAVGQVRVRALRDARQRRRDGLAVRLDARIRRVLRPRRLG